MSSEPCGMCRAVWPQVVVGPHKPCLAPHPREVYRAPRVGGELPVGVAHAFAVDEYVVHAFPLPCGRVVAVHHHIAPAGGAGTVHEYEVAVGQVVELGVGHILLAPAGHRLEVAEGESVRRYAPAISEGMAVVVERQMQIAPAVHRHGYDVVGVGHVALISRGPHLPCVVARPAPCHGDIAFGIVEAAVARVAARGYGVGTEHGGVHRCAAVAVRPCAQTGAGHSGAGVGSSAGTGGE